MYDVIIVGGSAAGLNAALVLGRVRRRVLVCDTHKPRNEKAHAAHGFLTRDGTPPAEILRIAREQLQPYDTVELKDVEIVQVQPIEGGFEAVAQDGMIYQARRILLATGLRDELPSIPGLAEYWANGVYHCPYCHGWEVRDQKLAIISNAEAAFHLGMLLRGLSDNVTAVVQGEEPLTKSQKQTLEQRGVRLYHAPIAQVEGNHDGVTGIRLEDGTLIACDAIFTRTTLHQHSPLAEQLGCARDAAGFVEVDMMGQSSVKGVYAVGDMANPMQQLIVAAASGARAAGGINHDLTFNG